MLHQRFLDALDETHSGSVASFSPESSRSFSIPTRLADDTIVRPRARSIDSSDAFSDGEAIQFRRREKMAESNGFVTSSPLKPSPTKLAFSPSKKDLMQESARATPTLMGARKRIPFGLVGNTRRVDLEHMKENRIDQIEEMRAGMEKMRMQLLSLTSMHQTEMEAKDAEIDARNAEIDAKIAELDAKNAELDAKRGEIDAKKIEIDARKTEIEAQDARIVSLQKQMEALRDENGKARERAQGAEKREQSVGERETKVGERERKVGERERDVAIRERDVGDQKRKVEENDKALRDREAHIKRSEENFENVIKELDKREADLAEKERQLAKQFEEKLEVPTSNDINHVASLDKDSEDFDWFSVPPYVPKDFIQHYRALDVAKLRTLPRADLIDLLEHTILSFLLTDVDHYKPMMTKTSAFLGIVVGFVDRLHQHHHGADKVLPSAHLQLYSSTDLESLRSCLEHMAEAYIHPRR